MRHRSRGAFFFWRDARLLKNGLLTREFEDIFPALFAHPEKHRQILEFVAKRHSGVSREELSQGLKIPSGGAIDRPLAELEASGFIERFVPFQKTVKSPWFRVSDEYALFYLRWIRPIAISRNLLPRNYWLTQHATPQFRAWTGYAFENLCLKHVNEILVALGIHGISSTVSSWRYRGKEALQKGAAQIDLVIDRADRLITICEIKYSQQPYSFSKTEADSLRRRIGIFRSVTKTRKSISVALVTPFGLEHNRFSSGLIDHVITLEPFYA